MRLLDIFFYIFLLSPFVNSAVQGSPWVEGEPRITTLLVFPIFKLKGTEPVTNISNTKK